MCGFVAERGGIMRLFIRFLEDESAATSIEYALIATGIALVILPAVTGVGPKVKTTFSKLQTALK
jgi:pilus assembly protein Flp/PilA